MLFFKFCSARKASRASQPARTLVWQVQCFYQDQRTAEVSLLPAKVLIGWQVETRYHQ